MSKRREQSEPQNLSFLQRVTLLTMRLILLLLIFTSATFAGCTDSTGPSSTNVGGGFTPTSDFGYSINAVTFSRVSDLSLTLAAATLDQIGGNGSGFLSIYLRSFPIVGHSTTIELSVSLVGPVPKTYAITRWGIPGGATLTIDSLDYRAIDSGVLTITKFDTVNNVVSGTFRFIGVHGGDTDQVTNGYFTNVGIYSGGYGQGTITADANHSSFPSNFSMPENIAAFIQSGSTTLVIQATDESGSEQQYLELSIVNPKVGMFSLGPSELNILPEAEYANSGGSPDVSVSTQQGASGTLEITQFDTLSHRISGAFHFSGPDATTGETVQVLNGDINNVQWFVL